MLPFQPNAQATAEERQAEPATPRKASDDINQQPRHDAPQTQSGGLAGDDRDAENVSEASTAPANPVVLDPNMALAVYRAPSVLPSEDVTSYGGPSLVPPTLSTWDNVPTPRTTKSMEWPELPLHLQFDQKIRNTPFEVRPEGSSTSSTTVTPQQDSENTLPLPWKYEFWWKDGALHSSWGPLRSARVSYSRQSIEISGATVGGSNGISESTHPPTALVARSDVSLHDAMRLEDEAYWAMRQRRGALAEFLVAHYWITHSPQRANRRNGETGQHSTNLPGPAPYTSTISARPSAKRGSSRRLVNGGGSGSGEDDDQDDGDDRFLSAQDLVLKRTRYLACPFQKWRPQNYKHCFYRLRYVYEVKNHVLANHFAPRCPECHRCFRTKRALTVHCTGTGCGARLTPDPAPDRISEQQRAIIRKRPVRKSVEQQWRDLFTTLFPNEPQPRDIYLDRRAEDAMEYISHHYHRCCRNVLHTHQAERARDDPFWYQFDTLEAQREAVAEQFIPTLMFDFNAQEHSDWSPALALDSDSRDRAPDTVATGSSLSPPGENQNQSLAPGITPSTLDSLRQLHGEHTGPRHFQPLGPLHAGPTWHLGSQFNVQPTIPMSHVHHAELDYQPITTQVVEQQPLVLPQLGQDVDLQLHRPPNEDLFAVAPQHNDGNTMFQPVPYSNNSSSSINPAISTGFPAVGWVTGPPFVLGPQGFAPVAVAGSFLYAPTPTNGTCDNSTTGYIPPSSHVMGGGGAEYPAPL
ncbi:C2H2-type domain-containing protein [Madurella fahalii]|uniref:C2H2-type domain-containing protein n=1 Tax=Madurella fahalii TaxID=1157608 RepID=A0ABQ0GQ76_9PEZI